tara:strand:- start:8 stop:190 length:183 start_codon:yes stop_codon:yes gene_type:complete
MSFPFSSEAFVIEPSDRAKPRRAGNPDDILPFLVALKDIDRESLQLPHEPAVFVDLPHAI